MNEHVASNLLGLKPYFIHKSKNKNTGNDIFEPSQRNIHMI